MGITLSEIMKELIGAELEIEGKVYTIKGTIKTGNKGYDIGYTMELEGRYTKERKRYLIYVRGYQRNSKGYLEDIIHKGEPEITRVLSEIKHKVKESILGNNNKSKIVKIFEEI